jgi:hypothetical protein
MVCTNCLQATAAPSESASAVLLVLSTRVHFECLQAQYEDLNLHPVCAGMPDGVR